MKHEHASHPTRLRCLIVDDDELSRMMLEHLVQQSGLLQLVSSCSSAIEALQVIQKKTVDVMFLDVEMPEMSGLELVKSLKRKPDIILVTAREHYAVEAFDVEVTDYVVKPVTLPRFLKAVNRVVERRRFSEASPGKEPGQDALYVKVKTQLVKIPTSDVLWVESNGDYVIIHTERENHVAHTTMKDMEQRLPRERFMRVHRSFIVQLAAIKAIEETLIVIGKKLIPIGETYRSTLLKQLNLV